MTSPRFQLAFERAYALVQLHAGWRKARAAIRGIHHRPNPQKRPEHAKRKQADPGRRADRVLMWAVAAFCNLVGDSPDRHAAVDHECDDHDKQHESDVIEHHRTTPVYSKTIW